MEHLRQFLEKYEAENKVEEVARLIEILDKACYKGLIPRRFMNAFYEHYFNGYGYEAFGGDLPAQRVWNDIRRKEWSETRVQETFEAAGYIYMKFEKAILKVERKQKFKESFPFWLMLIGCTAVCGGLIGAIIYNLKFCGIIAGVGVVLCVVAMGVTDAEL